MLWDTVKKNGYVLLLTADPISPNYIWHEGIWHDSEKPVNFTPLFALFLLMNNTWYCRGCRPAMILFIRVTSFCLKQKQKKTTFFITYCLLFFILILILILYSYSLFLFIFLSSSIKPLTSKIPENLSGMHLKVWLILDMYCLFFFWREKNIDCKMASK